MTARTLPPLALRVLLASGLFACDADPATIPEADVDAEISEVDTAEPDAEPDLVDDTSADTTADTTPDTGPSEVVEPDPDKTHRVIGGMSMGAMSLTIALERPYTFDLVGALGGYPDMTYMMAQMLRLHFAGFCDLPTLQAALPDLDQVSGCPAPTPRSELEFPQSFNHLHYDDNGITMSRGFYADIIDNFSSAFGNLSTLEHPQSPLHPIGLDLDWLRSTPSWERCQQNRPLDAAASFSLETNPDGLYPVYPLCDQSRPEASGLLPSEFDPDAPRTTPIAGLAFVDLDGDGVRHPEEPLFLNPWERFRDVGPDGCDNASEDGLGGCLETPSATATDPNGDDYHWRDNPSGLEKNDRFDPGEPYSDLGLDGLAAREGLPADLGEGNGRWDASPAFAHLLAHDADTLLESIPEAALDAMDFWVDGGIRDALHAGVVARRMVASLTSRGREPRVYHGFGGDLVPDLPPDEFALQVLNRDLSASAIGRDIYVEYGNPSATQAEIENGDGKHVGTTSDAINRLAAFLAAAFSRLSAPLFEVQELDLEVSRFDSFYSEALGARRGFTVLVPPSYDAPENAERRYPVIYFLHGLGQDASDLAAVGLATSVLMSQGTLPHVLLVFPDGACCFVDRETGARECACSDAEQGVRTCVDPTCTGPEETCEKRQIPDQNLERECHRGSLYADMRSDRWGEPRTNMGYKTSVHELVDHVDQAYRTRATRPAGVPPAADRPAR